LKNQSSIKADFAGASVRIHFGRVLLVEQTLSELLGSAG
jgi:hypothetical protein